MSPGGGKYPAESLGGLDRRIRLLTLLPGHGEQTISCTLRTVSLGDPEKYDALSYEWGDGGSPRSILVNGTEFHVGDNLFQALWHLRLPNIKRVLWIDAICINQSDLQERNSQVQQMANVYSQAYQVVAWIGLESEDSKVAFKFLQEAFIFSPRNRQSIKDDPGWQAVGTLCQRPYWRRVWIVQEICLAQRLIIKCGLVQIPWKYLSDLRAARKHIWPQYYSHGERAFMRSIPARIDYQRESRGKKDGCGLWALLEAFQESLCREVHDRVYGFIGLSSDCDSQGIPADYSKSVLQLYEDVMRFHHDKFQAQTGSVGPPHGPQLVRLSEFLLRLLGPDLEAESVVSLSRHIPESLMKISATCVVVIQHFLDAHLAKIHGASELCAFLQGKIPYSHLGRWRELVDPGVDGVRAIHGSRAALFSHVEIGHLPIERGQALRTKMAFLAQRPGRAYEPPVKNPRYVVGVAPEGTQLGDVVCTFLASGLALVFRPTAATSSSLTRGSGYDQLLSAGFTLVGRAVVDLSSDEVGQPFQVVLNPDKTVEMVQTKGDFSGTQDAPWPATISVDMPTLRLATRTKTDQSLQGFAKAMLNVLPQDDMPAVLNTTTPTDADLDEDELEVQKLQRDPQLTAGIVNLGATGSLSAAIQIIYMLKPLRTDILSNPSVRNSCAVGAALHDLFTHLRRSTLPASPKALTLAFGWGDYELHRPKAFPHLFEPFTTLLRSKRLGETAQNTFTSLFVGKSEITLKESGSHVVEQFFKLALQAHGSDTLEASLHKHADSYDRKTVFQAMPPVFLIDLNHSFLASSDTWEMVRTKFTYPSVLDVTKFMSHNAENSSSDLIYQLHGVVVLEEVEPDHRFLLYLRPRLENQWLLWFNETVTYAFEREAFEDNFRLDDKTAPVGAPLRTPVFFVYLRRSMLDTLLG